MYYDTHFCMPSSWNILQLPDLRLRKPYTVLPQPNAIDNWLTRNHVTSNGNVFNPGHQYMGDILSDQVQCTLQLNASVVSRSCTHSNHGFLKSSSRYNAMIFLRTLSDTVSCYMLRYPRHRALILHISVAQLSRWVATTVIHQTLTHQTGLPCHLVYHLNSGSLALLWPMSSRNLLSGRKILALYNLLLLSHTQPSLTAPIHSIVCLQLCLTGSLRSQYVMTIY